MTKVCQRSMPRSRRVLWTTRAGSLVVRHTLLSFFFFLGVGPKLTNPSECKHLMARMLVTDPKQRATMQEVMNHPWMTKGFGGPPDNYLPAREPLTLPLDPEALLAMQGFSFGSPEMIKAQVTKILESEDYQRGVKLYQREKDLPPPSKDSEKRKFGLDFYKRRNSGTSRDTLTGPSSEALQLGTDPLNAYSPLLSIYFLVREKQARERTEIVPPTTSSGREKDKEKERPVEHHNHQQEEEEPPVPELVPPQAAHTNAAAFEMPGEQPTGGRSRQRARTHGEDDAPESVKQGLLQPPEAKAEQAQKKEGTAAGLLRRFSTRKARKDPERLDRDRSHPPVVQVHSPNESAPAAPRKSFSIRRSRRDGEDGSDSRLRSGSSQPQHAELLSPPMSAAGSRASGKGLGRSTSVNSAEMRRREARRVAKEPPATSGSDQSVVNEDQASSQGAYGHSRSASVRAKSLGHARRESVQRRRLRREAQEANVPEETDAEQEQSGVSTDRLDSSDLAKPVLFKGLFSVSTTSGKSVVAIRTDIKRVLRLLNVEYTEIKGGFSCKHTPSIDLNKAPEVPGSPVQTQTPGHRRRFSLGGLMRGEDKEKEEGREDRPPMTPRTPGRSDRDNNSYSNSETSVESIPRREAETSRRAPGETSTQVQSDLGTNMVLEFEIFIVKVPLLTLHGIQFKRMEGNTWLYKSMADHILRELRL